MVLTTQPIRQGASYFWLFIAALGIPLAGLTAILFDIEISRVIYGQASPLGLSIEITSLVAAIALILLLHFRLAHAARPTGICRHVLDFLGIAHWHPAVKVSFVGLLALPLLWFAMTERWMFIMLRSLGRRALTMSDVQNSLDGLGVGYQLVLIGGLPLLFAQHLFCRWKPASRVATWLLLPLLFAGTLVATVILVTIIHFSQ